MPTSFLYFGSVAELLNRSGRVADVYTATAEDADYPDLFELWKLAMASARKSEELVDKLLHELDHG